MFVTIKKLDSSHEEESLRLYADSLKYDDYFQKAFGSVDTAQQLYTTYRQAVEYMLKQGNCYGAFVNGVMVGCILTVDYDILRNAGDEIMQMFYTEGDPYMTALREYNDSTYGSTQNIISIAIVQSYRNKGIATKLLKKYCKSIPSGTTVITDCYRADRPHLFTNCGFFEVDLQGEDIFPIAVRRF